MQTILVTGGCGYIGSHTVCELVKNNYDIIIIDNFINCSKNIIYKMEELTNRKLKLYKFDIGDKEKLLNVFHNHKIDAVIHFAALKSVSESISHSFIIL